MSLVHNHSSTSVGSTLLAIATASLLYCSMSSEDETGGFPHSFRMPAGICVISVVVRSLLMAVTRYPLGRARARRVWSNKVVLRCRMWRRKNIDLVLGRSPMDLVSRADQS